MINVIRDEKLKAALNEIYLNQPIDHNITEDQLVKLTGVLELENKGIKDLTGINYASHLTGLSAIPLETAFSFAHCTIPFEASTWQTSAPAFIADKVAQPV